RRCSSAGFGWALLNCSSLRPRMPVVLTMLPLPARPVAIFTADSSSRVLAVSAPGGWLLTCKSRTHPCWPPLVTLSQPPLRSTIATAVRAGSRLSVFASTKGLSLRSVSRTTTAGVGAIFADEPAVLVAVDVAASATPAPLVTGVCAGAGAGLDEDAGRAASLSHAAASNTSTTAAPMVTKDFIIRILTCDRRGRTIEPRPHEPRGNLHGGALSASLGKPGRVQRVSRRRLLRQLERGHDRRFAACPPPVFRVDRESNGVQRELSVRREIVTIEDSNAALQHLQQVPQRRAGLRGSHEPIEENRVLVNHVHERRAIEQARRGGAVARAPRLLLQNRVDAPLVLERGRTEAAREEQHLAIAAGIEGGRKQRVPVAAHDQHAVVDAHNEEIREHGGKRGREVHEPRGEVHEQIGQ